MALTPIPPIEPVLPDPPNPLDDETTFDAAAYAWSAALPEFGSDLEAIGSATYANALEAQTQATVATDKAVLTAADRVQTGLDRVQTGLDAAASAEMDKRYLGAKSTAPTLDNQGAALQTGAVYYDTTLAKVRTWTGSAWVEGISAVAGVTSVNGQNGAVTLSLLLNKAYDSRGDLRSLTPADGDAAVVGGLGLFVWESGSTEPDDDESCFVTASGAWLLKAAHWDLVDSWQSPEWQAVSDDDEDEPLRFASRIFTVPYTNTVSSVGANATLTQVVTVSGAVVGDAVIVTRSGPSGTNPQGVVFGVVTASNTVTVYYCAPSTSGSYFLTTGNWLITIIKP